MAQQLQYTSAERGLAEHAGFQFVAVSPSVTPDVRHAVIPFMSYRPPPRTPPRPDPQQCADLPISLCYQRVGEYALVVRCRYLGQDYSGRYGNFLGHAVVASVEELEGVRPIELWGAALWSDRPAAGALPELAEVDPGDEIGPDLIGRFLAERGEHGYATLAALLDAVLDRVTSGNGRVVMAAERADDIARWIAAISYSLPFDVTADLSFVTYTADPDSAVQLLVGTTPDVVAAMTRVGRVFRLDRGAGGAEPGDRERGRFAEVAVDAWRSNDLAAIDSLSELTALLDGDLTRAATLVAFTRGAALRADEPGAVASALRRAGRRLPDRLWADLAARLPDAGVEIAAAVFEAADPVRRKEIERPAAVPFTTALTGANDLAEVARLVRLAARAGITVPAGEVSAAAAACARAGAGDLLAAHGDCPDPYRRELLTGALSGLAATDETTRQAAFTPQLCDWLADRHWPAGHELAAQVWASVGRRHPDRRDDMVRRLVEDPEPRSPAELAARIASMWDGQAGTPAQCLALWKAVGDVVAAQADLLGLFGRTLATGKLSESDTGRLAGAVARLADDNAGNAGWPSEPAGARAVADARLIMELNAVDDAIRGGATPTDALARLQHWLGRASPALVTAIIRSAAELLCGLAAPDRAATVRRLAPGLRNGITQAWAELAYPTPQTVADLAVTVLTLRRERIGHPALDQRLARLVQPRSTRQHVERALRAVNPALVRQLGELVEATRPAGRRGVLSLFSRKPDRG